MPSDHSVIPMSRGVKLPKPAGGEMKVFDRIRGSEKSDELQEAAAVGGSNGIPMQNLILGVICAPLTGLSAASETNGQR